LNAVLVISIVILRVSKCMPKNCSFRGCTIIVESEGDVGGVIQL
jgi:hypothetical protein